MDSSDFWWEHLRTVHGPVNTISLGDRARDSCGIPNLHTDIHMRAKSMLNDSFYGVAPLKWSTNILCMACIKGAMKRVAKRHPNDLWDLTNIDIIAINGKVSKSAQE